MTRQDPTHYLDRERQFCSLCRAEGRHGVRIADLSRVRTIGRPAYMRERRRAIIGHLAETHPREHRKVTGG